MSRRSRSGRTRRETSAKAPRQTTAGPGTGGRLRGVLTKGMPQAANRPMVLVVAAMTAVVLGLGVGWTMNYFKSGQNRAAATPQECAAAQTAWTKAANAQTGISEENPATLRSGFINARDAMASITPPDGIAEEWDKAHSFYSTIGDAVEQKKAGDDEGIVDAAAAASSKVDTNAMLETSKLITEYVSGNCNA